MEKEARDSIRRDELNTPVTFTVTASEMIKFSMLNKLEQVCPVGRFRVEILKSASTMGYHLMIYAIINDVAVNIGEAWMADTDISSWAVDGWENVITSFRVNDDMKAKIMLIYGSVL